MAKSFESFLGANTPYGFVSFFDEMYNPYENCRAYIIKGGPGTGKSSLMKRVCNEAERRGYATERVYCSSDPSSLDGLIIPELGVSIADGTSPHTLEARFPGACENIINAGDFWDKKSLYAKADEIRSLSLENSLHHRRSSKYLAAAGNICEENMRIVSRFVDKAKAENFAYRFAQRELPDKKSHRPGRKMKRFVSGITPKGLMFLSGGIKALASRVIAIDDEYSAVSGTIAETIGETAVRKGYDVIFCYCPMKPKLQCEHIIIPEKRLALMSVRSDHRIDIEFDRIIHAKRFFYEGITDHTSNLRFNRKLTRELTDEAVSALKNAKSVHDNLERLYVDAMDFDKFDLYAEKLCSEIFI